MFPSKPDLVILPCKATLIGSNVSLTLEQTLCLLRSPQREFAWIERSYPEAAATIGWTIFHRTPGKYLYEHEPLFRFERGIRRLRRIRKAYAIHYSMAGDHGTTYSHLHL